jgi:hypothetical protein
MKEYGGVDVYSHIFLTSALAGGEWSTLPPWPLYPQYQLYRSLCGPQSRSQRRGEQKILDLTGTRNSDLSVFQPVVSRYTDWAIPAPLLHDVTWQSLKMNSLSSLKLLTHEYVCVCVYGWEKMDCNQKCINIGDSLHMSKIQTQTLYLSKV